MEALDILFVTDYVCPYCLVAKVALEEALRETGMEAAHGADAGAQGACGHLP